MLNKRIKCSSLRQKLAWCLYSKETYNLLNYLTLEIKDPIIRKKFNDLRCQNFKSLFLPVASLVIFFLVVLLPFFWKKFFTGKALQSYVRLFNVAVWAVMNYCWPKYAPICTNLALFTYSMLWYLKLEDFQSEGDSRGVEIKIMQLVIILSGINYNSFKTNVLLMTPALLVPYILILHKTSKMNE